MGGQNSRTSTKHLCLGLLAHVDAGKTTLSEALLFAAGNLRKAGRVDNGDAFLDNYELERERGITIFSKQAELSMPQLALTLLDTPGHVDFSAEMERTLQVLDAAVLVVSGADGVQGHTRTLWRLLARYRIPTFLFINKMDQPGADRAALLADCRAKLSDACADFTTPGSEEFYETAAMCEEALLERYLEEGTVPEEEIRRLIRERKLFPCYFGSALRMQGIEELLQGLAAYGSEPEYPPEFGAKVYKITRDGQGSRLTWMKITGGTLCARDLLCGTDREGEEWSEKVNQIRIYSGARYEAAGEAAAGTICAVTGLTGTFPGEGLGAEPPSELPLLEPVLSYSVQLPDGVDAAAMLPKLKQLEEEEPELSVVWDEELQEIHARLMGEVQIEILERLIAERFGVQVAFGEGKIVYRETIADTVEGVGHFEPLRHYAEVHLILAPGERGGGLVFDSACSEDILNKNWQRLVLTHLAERQHRGVLTGSAITDMRITLVSGRAHVKHTEGGDFRQATYRAVRQGLMQAESVLLEPWYEFRLVLPQTLVGRAMTDLEKMHGNFQAPETEGELAVLSGTAPVAAMRNYQKEVTAYSRGRGQLTCSLAGYFPCHNPEEVIAAAGYDPELDMRNPTGSVFCTHGAGFTVPWYEVKDYMHLESSLDSPPKEEAAIQPEISGGSEERFIGTEEIDAILARTYYANGTDKSLKRKGVGVTRREYAREETPARRTIKKAERKEEYLLVDGYNIIFAWPELTELADGNVDAARGALQDILSNYQGIRRCRMILVFDAYRVAGHETETFTYHNIRVVYTKEAETADQYIEKFAHENASKYQVTVATSDGLEQIIIRSQGCRLLSARDLREEIDRALRELRENYRDKEAGQKNFLLDHVSAEVAESLKKIRDNNG